MYFIFNLENCPYCVKAVELLKSRNLAYLLYEVNNNNKEIAKEIIRHMLIISLNSIINEKDKKKYKSAIQSKNYDLIQDAMEVIGEKKITFPQIFVCKETLVKKIQEYQVDFIQQLELIDFEDVEHIGGYDSIAEKLQLE